MENRSTATKDVADLEALALAFVVQVQGTWMPEALQTFRAELAGQKCTATESELQEALEHARQHFDTGAAHFFLCTGVPCQQRQKFDSSAQALGRLQEDGHLVVTRTACQGPCKHAPVATLRVGQRCEMFAQFMRETDWRAVVDFAERAAAAGTLLISPGEAQPFRFDPVHDHDNASGPLQELQFLLGHFQGEGTFADGTPCFQKEAVGTWEVNGRFLGLRMGVTYPLADGQKDTHTALVMLGVNSDTGDLEGRVYTDGGSIHDYHLEFTGEAVRFNDRPEAHHNTPASRARKILRVTDYGFEERLELDRGSGQFELYYVVPMHRTPSASQGSKA